MGIFGWSLPPGCGTLPGEEDGQPYQFDNDFGFDWVEAVYWDEGGKLFAVLTNGREFDIGVYEGEDVIAAKRVALDYFDEIRGIQKQVIDLINNHKPIAHTPRTVEEFLEDCNAPEGDFCWDDSEAGDWTPYYCYDCDTWHKTADAFEISRKAGKVEVLYRTVDQDGNWECDSGWSEAEGDSVEHWADFYQHYVCNDSSNHFKAWARYHLWCMESLQDPCDDCLMSKGEQDPLKHAKHALDYANYLISKG